MELEIIPDRLYWVCDNSPPRNKPNAFYFSIDNFLIYQPFADDFGPLNLAMTHKFCIELDRILKDQKFAKNRIYHYCLRNPAKKANAAFLMGAFQVLVLKRPAAEAWAVMEGGKPFKDFRDASQVPCNYKCTIEHCLLGLQRAVTLGWFDLPSFNAQFYEHHEQVENGDFNWIVPGKFLAFSNPATTPNDVYGFRMWTPKEYVPVFKKLGVTTVIRLNNKTYDENIFKKAGIAHHDLFFVDGSCPPPEIAATFLEITEATNGAIAVHCKAGLGRTGTLIGLYCMKHFAWPAEEFIAWNRICRPGSILGP